MEYGADRARTNKQRDIQSRLNTLPTPAAIQTGLYVTMKLFGLLPFLWASARNETNDDDDYLFFIVFHHQC